MSLVHRNCALWEVNVFFFSAGKDHSTGEHDMVRKGKDLLPTINYFLYAYLYISNVGLLPSLDCG